MRRRWLVLPAVLGLLVSALGARAARPERLESEHFIFSYDPDRLTEQTARQAVAAAERGYEHCRGVFGREPSARIQCDLTPRFFGATGFAMASGRPLRIGVRYADLDYLGLTGVYVLTHEIAHIFSGRDAEGPLGEGLADFVAGSFNEMPLAPWCGHALRDYRLWTDVDGLFVTGDYPPANELDARVRISQYTEPALLLLYLAHRFGFERVQSFLPAYTRARHSLASNGAATEHPAGPPSNQGRRPRRPDAGQVRAVFKDQFGVPWETIRDDWLAQMGAAAPPAGCAERLVLAQEIYASIRGYESWLMRSRLPAEDPRRTTIREAFTRANRALRNNDTATAAEELRAARALFEGLRRPAVTVDTKFVHPFDPIVGL